MWGAENWGSMVWGGITPVPVPLTSPIGIVILVAALIGCGIVSLRSRLPKYTTWLSVGMLLIVPITAYAAIISVPNTFTNGTIADATEVNANFDGIVSESNAQHARIAALESQLATFASQILALQTDVSTN